MAAMRVGWRDWLAARWLLGLKHPGGRPRQPWKPRSRYHDPRLVGTTQLARDMNELIEAFPKPPSTRPEEWDHPTLLMETARRGLMRVLEVVSEPIDGDTSDKDKRLAAEMGLGAARLLANVQEASMRQATDKGWDEILARIAQERQKSSRKPSSEKKSIKTVDSGKT